MAATVLEDAFSQIRAARMVVLVSSDSEDAEGDLVMAAEKVTPQHVNFMVIQGRGVVSVALPEKRLRELGIPLVASSMGSDLVEQAGALVEAREGVTTGISAGDRATTIGVLASDKSGPENLVMPGHILPLMALSGGVMMRMGRAEGAVDLVRSAGMRPAAKSSRAVRSPAGRSRLPTWSARNGGVVRALMILLCVKAFTRDCASASLRFSQPALRRAPAPRGPGRDAHDKPGWR